MRELYERTSRDNFSWNTVYLITSSEFSETTYQVSEAVFSHLIVNIYSNCSFVLKFNNIGFNNICQTELRSKVFIFHLLNRKYLRLNIELIHQHFYFLTFPTLKHLLCLPHMLLLRSSRKANGSYASLMQSKWNKSWTIAKGIETVGYKKALNNSHQFHIVERVSWVYWIPLN